MKLHLLKYALLASTLLVLTNCKKFGKDFDTYFYTDVETTDGTVSLFVDGNYKGILPSFQSAVSLSNDTILQHALHLRLKSGRYSIVAKDHQGYEKFRGSIKFKSSSWASSSQKGGCTNAYSSQKVVSKLKF